MSDGFYAIYYTGLAGTGFGLIALMNGSIIGADVAGGNYDGSYKIDKNTALLEGNVKLLMPSGSALVTGAISGNEPLSMNIPLSLPIDLGNGHPVEVLTATGPVNVIFKKLRSLPA